MHNSEGGSEVGDDTSASVARGPKVDALLDEFAVPTSDGDLLVSQPKGTVTTTAHASQWRVQSAGIARTARIIADAVVHPA